jgi:tRNA (guanine37-N1)-methyltransferase
MVLRAEPFVEAVEFLRKDEQGARGAPVGAPGQSPVREGEQGAGAAPVVVMSARGRRFSHDDAVRFSLGTELTILCGHYKDIDQRVVDLLGAEEVSIGDFVLSGGEPAALCVLDAVVRLLPGAIGDHESASSDSHYDGLLSPPSYTRPAEVRGAAVPEVLLSGNHAVIAAWRQQQAEALTKQRRPDLWAAYLATEHRDGDAKS